MNPVDQLARRVESDPLFLACALAEYAASERLDDADLARTFGCSPEMLTRLRLCRMPREDGPGFRADIHRIAEHVGVKADRLACVVRQVQALRQLRDGAQPGTLLAARDREDASKKPTED